MAHRIRVEAHLAPEELYRRYRSAKKRSEQTHWQILWMISQGKTSVEVSEATGFTLNWVRELVGRYNRKGPDAMEDGRSRNPGRIPLLAAEQRSELAAALRAPAPGGGLWSGPKVARWMSRKLKKPVVNQRGWDYLRRAGYTPQIPRPRHAGGDKDAQEAFQEVARRARGEGKTGPSGSGP